MSRSDDDGCLGATCANGDSVVFGAARYGGASAGAAHREAIDPERRLTDADRNALAVLAAGADAIVELQVVADHRDARQNVGTVPDERRALEWRADATVLDGVGFA